MDQLLSQVQADPNTRDQLNQVDCVICFTRIGWALAFVDVVEMCMSIAPPAPDPSIPRPHGSAGAITGPSSVGEGEVSLFFCLALPKYLPRNRPENPLAFLANYLLKNNPQRRANRNQ